MILTILSVVVALAFIAVGAARIRLIPMMFDQARRLGIHYPQYRLFGGLEVIFALLVLAGIWIGWMGTFGSLMLTVLAAIAILFHARANDALQNFVVPAALGVLAFIVMLMHIYA